MINNGHRKAQLVSLGAVLREAIDSIEAVYLSSEKPDYARWWQQDIMEMAKLASERLERGYYE